jgi:hypothetical protein
MNIAAQRREQIQGEAPLCDSRRDFGAIIGAPFLLGYLKQVLVLAPTGSRSLEAWGAGQRLGHVP